MVFIFSKWLFKNEIKTNLGRKYCMATVTLVSHNATEELFPRTLLNSFTLESDFPS